MKLSTFSALSLLAVVAASCDEGRIYDNYEIQDSEGLSAHITATLMGADEWPQGYTLAVAGFADGSEYALVSKNVEAGSDGRCDMVLTGIPSEVNTLELCAIDRLRRRVASFTSIAVETADTTRLNAGTINVSPATAIQSEIFNTTCVQCHGGANFAAAGLDLTPGKAFSTLVDVESVKEPGTLRVYPGNSAASLLYRILSTDESSTWNYDHSVEVVTSTKLDLIKSWIDSGAKH